MISSSPHQTSPANVSQLMLHVGYALVPGIITYVWLFGAGVLIHILLACATAVTAEALVLMLRKRPVASTLTDSSAILTAVLLALAIPPLAPWWLTVLGAAFAIILGKQLYGGLGYNPFNPAMLGYAMLLISFPLEMTRWPAALSLLEQAPSLSDSISVIFASGVSVDAISAATPLDTLKTQISQGMSIQNVIASSDNGQLFGRFAGIGWESINIALLLGGLYLLFTRRIAWQIPISMLLSIALLAGIFHYIDPQQYASPMLHLFGGATMLGAFFIATDPVSACTTPRGRILYGVGIATITYAIRNWGGYPDGIAFAVLLMNMAAPTIDYFTQPRVFGGGKQ
jgi:electron transport complex protein RnfD